MLGSQLTFWPGAELLIKGLLTARYGCLLLVITLANNPSLVDHGAHLLAQILKIYSDASEARPNSPHIQDISSSATNTMTGLAINIYLYIYIFQISYTEIRRITLQSSKKALVHFSKHPLHNSLSGYKCGK